MSKYYSYSAKKRVLQAAKVDLVAYAHWGGSTMHLEILDQILMDLIALESKYNE